MILEKHKVIEVIRVIEVIGVISQTLDFSFFKAFDSNRGYKFD
jgi:hypothetical protein